MNRIIEYILSRFSYVKSLKADADFAASILDTSIKQNCEINSLKAENESLQQEVAAYREDLEELGL